MILHFPIVLVIAYVVWEWWIRRPGAADGAVAAGREVSDGLLLAAAVVAAVTALMGMLLSREPAYEGSAIGWHKWLGTLTSLGLWALWSFRDFLRARLWGIRGGTAALLVLILLAGHLGGDLTHGTGFVLGPVQSSKEARAPLEEALVYADLVEPIFDSRCASCHNSDQSKGGLVMDSKALLLKGGKDGKLWDTADSELGLLMRRIHLPAEEKKHMPPANKTQLTDAEEKILYYWIKGGSSFDQKVAELSPTDPLRVLAAGILKGSAEEKYDFSAADEKKVQSLNTNYRVVTPLANGSPALAVDFYGIAAFQSAQLKELDAVKEQVVSLNLDKMPVTDADLPVIAGLHNLRVLNLDFSHITGKGLSALRGLSYLRNLSLSGVPLRAEDLAFVRELKSLHTLYVWNTGLGDGAAADLEKEQRGLSVISGFRGDTVHIKLNAPLILTEERVIKAQAPPLSLELKHYVPGVTIRYTLDGRDPDSGGIVYAGPIPLVTGASLKAKAYKGGWIASDAAGALFFHAGYRVDSILLLQPIDSNYMKFKPGVLIDEVKGDFGFGSGKWLGFRKKGLECLLFFKEPARISSVTLSSLVDVNAYVMPPVVMEVWGGSDRDHLRLLGRQQPEQPVKAVPAYFAPYEFHFAPASVRCLKVIARPVDKLPDWHPGKGQKGWFMADEIFVN